MFEKSVGIDVVANTFPKNKIPPLLKCPPVVKLDVASALLMLGNITMPNVASKASPARFWAWIRYFIAVSKTDDFRITDPFVDLDPHQKTILSDDIGVALTTQWFFNQLGSVTDIVDGRRFVVQYANLVKGKPKRKTPKIGRNKCPDFVIQDGHGFWHVLECKGTQGPNTRKGQLKTAIDQKQVIDIKGSIKGERLAAGLLIASERDMSLMSNIRVVDPDEVDPYIVMTADRKATAQRIAHRLTISRALGLSGMELLSEEVALPESIESVSELFTPREKLRSQIPREERFEQAIGEARALPQHKFTSHGTEFLGRSGEFEIADSDFLQGIGYTRIRVEQGINAELSGDIRKEKDKYIEAIEALSADYLDDSNIKMERSDKHVSIDIGELFSAKMLFD